MEKTYNLVELFSGIGSQAKALKNLGIAVNLQGTSEWDVHAIAAYDVIHNNPEIPSEIQNMSKEQMLEELNNYTFSNSGKAPMDSRQLRSYSEDALRRIYTSVVRNKNFVDVTRLNGASLPNGIDILTYSFPCQDLSNVGAFHGYTKGIDKDSGSRSSLLWQVGRILTEMKSAQKTLPRFLLLENVPTLLSPRHFENFQTWISDLENLGYVSHYYQLNASAFGLPQNRPRLLMISVYVGNNYNKWRLARDYFEKKKDAASIVSDYRNSRFFTQYTVPQLLRTNYSNKKIMAEAIECTPNDTESRRKIWEDNPQIILSDGSFNTSIDVIRTITTKQDRNPNSGNLFFESGIEGRSKFRYLTPRECLLFMGFSDDDYKQLKYHNVEFHKGDKLFARDKVIRMAGNSIPVKLLEGIFYQILQIDDILNTLQDCFTDKESHICQTPSELIRSYLFKNGIRSRVSSHDDIPTNATVVYPKYKTAIYVWRNFCGGRTNDGEDCRLCADSYWKKRCGQTSIISQLDASEALSKGWNVISVKFCELNKNSQQETLSWILRCVKSGIASESCGKVFTQDHKPMI